MITEMDLKRHGFVTKDNKANMEMAEDFKDFKPVPTGYPAPARRYRLMIEGYNISIEEPYFWILHYLRYDRGFPYIDKITDIFSAAENSAFFGAAQQRLSAQQDKVSQYLATVGKMVKELFQLVRELRILDERLGYYADSYSNSQSRESAEITLKGIWVDMVEQGAKNPASVYGMAREVQFVTLPDLFFSTHPARQEDVDIVVDKTRSNFNRKVREVLKRKLRTFLAWKEHTYEEMKNRRVFTLKYFRQHYDIIKMYLQWIKPYLKNIQRLQLDHNKVDSPDILVAFETSMIEVELLARKPTAKGKCNSVILTHFLFRTRPEMSYSQDYQRGPLHSGRIEINFRAYGWSDEQIENYKRLKEQEDFQLLGIVDQSVKVAMDSLGDELMRYLQEAGEPISKHPEDKEKGLKKANYSPLKNSFANMFKAKKAPKPKKKNTFEIEMDTDNAIAIAKEDMWRIYHHFKKHHAMLSW